jgi:hypothetical protein
MKPHTKQLLSGLFLALIGFAWLAMIQVGMEITYSSLLSTHIDQIDSKRTDFDAFEIRRLLGRFASAYKRSISPIWLPAIPISTGFFLLGSVWQTWRRIASAKA